MRTLVIRIPLEGNDLEDMDFDVFVEEAKHATGMEIGVARSVSEEESHIGRLFRLRAYKFEAAIEE